ncbi:MAG: flagellar hook basal-body protein [Holophaga sp.]|nr:flagellar hook basal-body protein [Holophaga sp.]
MDPAYYVAAGSLRARSYQMDVVSNNLANASTVGYKTEKTFFSIYNKAKVDGRGLPLSSYVNEGTVMAQSGVDFSQGNQRTTGRSLDLSIDGNAFFMLQTPQGPQATRDGRFMVGKDGRLSSLDGYPLLGKNNLPIPIDPAGGPVKVLLDGTVQQGENTQGQIDLQAVANPSALQRLGANRYSLAGVPPAASNATVNQGSLEQSGVDMASCMIDLVRLNRMFEMSMKVASTVTNDMDEKSITDISTGH